MGEGKTYPDHWIDPYGRDMPTQEFRRHGQALVEWIADYLENPHQHRVVACCNPGELQRLLPYTGPAEGESMEAILADFNELVLPRVSHWNHPDFHAYFSVSSSGPGILGELLTAALNVNAMLWKSCPAATELEQIAAAWVLDWLSLPGSWFGMILDSASTAVLHAMVAAREKVEPESRAIGPSGKLTAYISEHTHSSVEKAAIAAGIGQSNVRRIGVDSCFRMDSRHLAQTIGDDIASGCRPFFAVATVGTTSSTAVDPVVEIADICRANDIWLHVDGAYGGSFGFVPECRHFLDGVERADSFVINPHKGMMVPLDCSLFYSAHPDILRNAFSLEAEYLRTDVEAVDYMDYGLALGRRFRALKLWFVLRYFGRNGLVANLRESLRMAAWLAEKIADDTRLELAAPLTMGLVCFRVRRGDSATKQLMRRINDSGDFFVSHTVLDGKVIMRVAIGNIRTRQQNIEELWVSILGIFNEIEAIGSESFTVRPAVRGE
jgi:aromatic-L-amino-acid/L-tryptophan decarboxylase